MGKQNGIPTNVTKAKLTVYLDREVFLDIQRLKLKTIESSGRDAISTSEFVQTEVFVPYINKERKKGSL